MHDKIAQYNLSFRTTNMPSYSTPRNGGKPELLMENFISNQFDMVMVSNIPTEAAYQFSHIAQEHGAIAAATVCPESICYFPTPQQACNFTIAIHGMVMGQHTISAEGHHIGGLDNFQSFMEHFRIKKNVPMFRMQPKWTEIGRKNKPISYTKGGITPES